MRRLSMVGVLGLVVAATAAAGASAATTPGVTRVVSPRPDTVVGGKGRVQVVLRSRASLRSLHVTLGGRDITSRLRRSKGAYRATVRRGRGLRRGVNYLHVATGRNTDIDSVRIIVARQVHSLLSVRDVQVGGRESPGRVVMRARPGTRVRAWVNGHRVDHAFQPHGRRYIGRLGANDFVRPGRNRLVVLTHRAHHSGRSAVYDVERVTFRHKRGRVIAGAGRDRVIDANDLAELNGSAAGRGSGGDVDYQWRVVAAPPGARDDVSFDDAPTRTPQFVATTPGRYRVRATVTAPNGATSADTLTVAVRADTPPIGWRLDTTDARGAIKLNGVAVPNTTFDGAGPSVSYAVFDRQLLTRETSGNRPADAAGLKAVADLAQSYFKSPSYLMIVNLSALQGLPADAKRLFTTLGVTLDEPYPATARPVSLIGVPGSRAGSGFISDHYRNRPALPLDQASLSGYIRLNPIAEPGITGGHFEFVYADQLEFDTDADPALGRIALKIGGKTYPYDVPTDGRSGFLLAFLDSRTGELDAPASAVFVTNNADGSQNVENGVRFINGNLGWAVQERNRNGERLAVLQSFGRPWGASGLWLQSGDAIQKLGGNAQPWVQMNQGAAEPPGGAYAFVGRIGMDVPGAESSQWLTKQAADGTLHGLLARGRDDQYEPMLAESGNALNAELVALANRPSPPDGGFPQYADGQAEAFEFLARDERAMGLCFNLPRPCDVRKMYYDRYGIDWGGILTALSTTAKDECEKTHVGFTPKECEGVRSQLVDEVRRRNQVAEYFGPAGLQAPFVGGGQVGVLADVQTISNEIRADVTVPVANNAVSHVLTIVTGVLKVATLSGLVCSPCGTVAGGLSGAVGLAAYLTHQDGSPDIVGPAISSTAANLGGDLLARYQRVSAYLQTEAKIIMSDYDKMTEVARRSRGDWSLSGSPVEVSSMLRNGAQQGIYKSLVAAGYPVLYDLGRSPSGPSAPFEHATQWYCNGGTFAVDQHLFQKTGLGAEVRWRQPLPPYEYHVMAIGGERTVLSGHDAYVPAPSQKLTDKLFKDPGLPPGDGIGLNKLEFYSSRYFKPFPRVLQQDSTGLGLRYCRDMPNPPGH